MFKKFSVVIIALILIVQSLSSFALAADNNNQNMIQGKVITEVVQSENFRYGYLTPRQLSILLNVLGEPYSIWNEIADVDVTLRDYTGDGVLDIAIVYTDVYNYKHLHIYTITGNNAVRIFSGAGSHLNLNRKNFSISNVKYDGRYFYETYTYEWSQIRGRFLRIGYAKTYIRDYDGNNHWRPIKPITKDERIKTVSAFLNERMNGRMESAENYLSESNKAEVDAQDLKALVPYGKVTAIDIFDSQRGDWVVVVIRDYWGRSRVFKFVPIEEENEFGKFKIDNIIEIPEAK